MIININYSEQRFAIAVTKHNGKNMSITVNPDLSICAKFPKESDKRTIEQRLKKKASWIAKQINYFSTFQPTAPEKKYISGETHYYLGRQYRLKIRKLKKAQVKLKGGFFMVGLPNPHNNMHVKKLMQNWYTEHAIIILNDRIAKYLSKFTKLGAKKPAINFRRMKKRWGSCNDRGNMLFNLELIKTPRHCIDYVITHELCHLLSNKHDKKFYSLLEKILPGWKISKEKLEIMSARI
ncbi:MAG: SprT family zinc-dependent metalloprotease [Gammaproteobacteria bacterium]|jgi:predicted metal-dependent hydrolase